MQTCVLLLFCVFPRFTHGEGIDQEVYKCCHVSGYVGMYALPRFRSQLMTITCRYVPVPDPPVIHSEILYCNNALQASDICLYVGSLEHTHSMSGALQISHGTQYSYFCAFFCSFLEQACQLRVCLCIIKQTYLYANSKMQMYMYM